MLGPGSNTSPIIVMVKRLSIPPTPSRCSATDHLPSSLGGQVIQSGQSELILSGEILGTQMDSQVSGPVFWLIGLSEKKKLFFSLG